MEFHKKVLVAGAGKSGIGAADMLAKAKAQVILYDGNENAKVGDKPYQVVLGKLDNDLLTEVEVCVISPGIPLDAPFVSQLKENGIPIWSEIELAYRFARGRLAAITGTNGKTTTTALVGEIFKTCYESSFVVGNIGIAYTKEALYTTETSVTVAEVSSFQLETILTFHPNVSAILNITEDHLNRHKTMEAYIKVKESITKNQTMEDTCVLNYEDEELRRFGETLPVKVVYFSSLRALPEGLFLDGEKIVWKREGVCQEICHIKELSILGKHNYENVMAAVAVASSMGVPMDCIRKALLKFQAVEHRIEFTAEVNGVRYYNDSKGTNPDAAAQAVKAMERPTVLIAGGYDKNSSYEKWISAFGTKVKAMILLGQTAKKIERTARKMGFTNNYFVNSMEEAVALAAKLSEPGDAVLLSPACASWGMFKDYEERGRIFKSLVHDL